MYGRGGTETCEMALDDSVQRTGDGSRTASGQRRSQAFDSQHARGGDAGGAQGPRGEFAKLRHYVRQMHGLLLDKQA